FFASLEHEIVRRHVPDFALLLRVVRERHSLVARKGASGGRDRDAQAHEHDAADLVGFRAVVFSHHVRLESLHRGPVRSVEKHGAIETALLVFGVNGKERAHVDLDHTAAAGVTLGAILDRVCRRVRKERGDLAKKENGTVDDVVKPDARALAENRYDVEKAK